MIVLKQAKKLSILCWRWSFEVKLPRRESFRTRMVQINLELSLWLDEKPASRHRQSLRCQISYPINPK